MGVSDLDDFAPDDGAYARFREHKHSLFVEVKWLSKGLVGHTWERFRRRSRRRPARRIRRGLEPAIRRFEPGRAGR